MHDPVNSPFHYASGSIECIDAIEASMSREAFKGFLKGNIIKYIWRYEDKGGVESLRKAEWYSARLIAAREEEEKLRDNIMKASKEEEKLRDNIMKTSKEVADNMVSYDPDAYMVSGCASTRQGPSESFFSLVRP
jgi:hypothetical protein